MITISAREAGLGPALLDKVHAGEEVLITRQGKTVARLVAVGLERQRKEDEDVRRAKLDETIRKIVKLRKQMNLGELDWKALRDEGRR